MNVFVLSTGRTGSLSLERACRQITNYSAAHESKCQELGSARVAFPDGHIEIDNRLSWYLGRLEEHYGKNAFYVHMIRERNSTAISYQKRWHRETGILRAFTYGIQKRQEHEIGDLHPIALDYVDCVNENIRAFLRDKPGQMTFNLENAESDFKKFWHAIGAEGDFEKAWSEFNARHNESSQNEKLHNKPFEKAIRIIKKFPYFLKNA